MLSKFSHLSQVTMDPLSAISLASAVISFIDFGCQITSEAHEIYRSSHGLTQDFEEIQDACERSKELTEAIKSTVNATDHEGLQTLADSCLETAGEITTVLNRLKSSSSGGISQGNLKYPQSFCSIPGQGQGGRTQQEAEKPQARSL